MIQRELFIIWINRNHYSLELQDVDTNEHNLSVMCSSSCVSSGKCSLSSIVDNPSFLIHKSTMDMVILCNSEEVTVIGCICPVVGNLVISDCEGNVIVGSFDDEQNGQIATMNMNSTIITGYFNVYKGIIDSSEDLDLAEPGILDLSDDGDRWEGQIFHEKPFGWGSLVNSQNLLSYVGFMINGQRVGFGYAYYPDIENEVIEYEGNYCFDKRFGIGHINDLNGDIIQDGFSVGLSTQIIPAMSDDICMLQTCVKSLVISSCCCRYKSFCSFSFDYLSILHQLKNLTIEWGCFQHFQTFSLDSLDQLEILVIGDSSFVLSAVNQEVFHPNAVFSLQNCRNLKSVVIGKGSFQFFGLVQFLELKSLEVLMMHGSNFIDAPSFCLKGGVGSLFPCRSSKFEELFSFG